MSEPHARFEALAVGHVLGGLAEADATAFRAHLISCRNCRLRVAELRDLAADLAAAEREERQRARIKTEVARREDPDDEHDLRDGPWRTPSPRAVALVGMALLLAVVGLATWAFHQRTVNAVLLATAERQDLVMEAFAVGTTVATTLVPPVTGRVAITEDTVAVSFGRVPPIASDRRVVIWLVSGDDAEPVFVGRSATDGRVAWAAERGDADRLLVTVELWTDVAGREPEGAVLAEADLTSPLVDQVPQAAALRSSFADS